MTMIKRNRFLLAVGACLVVFVAACASRSLVFTTYTDIGLDVGLANDVPAKVVLGYKRFEGAVIPVDLSRQQATSGTPPSTGTAVQKSESSQEAMSVYAALNMKNTWSDGLKLVQVFATGDAAVSVAHNPTYLVNAITSLRAADAADATATATKATTSPTPSPTAKATSPTPSLTAQATSTRRSQ
jgi:hypothetical protein